MTPNVAPKEPTPRKDKNTNKSKVPGIIAIVAIVLVVIALIYVLLPSASKFGGNGTMTTETETATSTQKKPAPAEEEPVDNDIGGPFEGWQKYSSKAWGVSARFPAGWTTTETTGSLSVIFLGPPTPAGGVILNECSYSIFVEDVSASMGLEAYSTAARTAPQGAGDINKQIDTSIDGNEAIQIEDTYVEAGQPWKRLRTWTIKNNKAYTLTYAASINYNKVNYYIMHESEAEQIESSIVIK